MQSRTLKKDKESREEGRGVEKNISLIKNKKYIKREERTVSSTGSQIPHTGEKTEVSL